MRMVNFPCLLTAETSYTCTSTIDMTLRLSEPDLFFQTCNTHRHSATLTEYSGLRSVHRVWEMGSGARTLREKYIYNKNKNDGCPGFAATSIIELQFKKPQDSGAGTAYNKSIPRPTATRHTSVWATASWSSYTSLLSIVTGFCGNAYSHWNSLVRQTNRSRYLIRCICDDWFGEWSY